MSNRNVARNWRGQTGIGRNGSNMYYEGKTIFSYGSHFPMAYITSLNFGGKDIVLQNSYGYSNSTAKHLNYMRGECFGDAVITIGTPILKDMIFEFENGGIRPATIARAIEEIEARKADQAKKLSRARVEHMKELYIRDMAENDSQLEIIKSL